MANFVSQLFISFHTSENIYFLFWFAPTKNFLICFFYYSWTQVWLFQKGFFLFFTLLSPSKIRHNFSYKIPQDIAVSLFEIFSRS